MPTVNQGVRGTGIIGTETRRSRDVTPSLLQLEPDAAPLTTIMAKVRKRATEDPKFEWFEDELNPRFDTLDGAIDDSQVTMDVDNFAYFRKGDLVKVNNAEIVRVTATPTTATVAIKRAVGETAGVAASDADRLHILSPSDQEGAGRRDLLSTQRVAQFNYAQIVKTPYGVTNTNKGTKQFAGQDLDEERAKKLIEHKRSIEEAILFGERHLDTSGTHPQRATRGLIKTVSTNITDAGGALTEPEFEDFLRPAYRYGSKQKMLFCSPKVIQVINSYGREKLQTFSDDRTYGVTMTQYKNAGRMVMLVEHVLFTNDSLTDLTDIAGYALLLDLMDLELRYMRGQIVMLEEDIQANDEDQKIDQYLSELGIEAHLEKKHALLTGVTG